MLLVDEDGGWDPVNEDEIRGVCLALLVRAVIDGADLVGRALDRVARSIVDVDYIAAVVAYLAGAVTAELHRLRGVWASPTRAVVDAEFWRFVEALRSV